jgi:hypothetical protein
MLAVRALTRRQAILRVRDIISRTCAVGSGGGMGVGRREGRKWGGERRTMQGDKDKER